MYIHLQEIKTSLKHFNSLKQRSSIYSKFIVEFLKIICFPGRSNCKITLEVLVETDL